MQIMTTPNYVIEQPCRDHCFQTLEAPIIIHTPPPATFPEQARKDPKAFCAAVLWVLHLEHQDDGWFRFGGGLIANTDKGTIECRGDGSYRLPAP